MSSVVIFLEFLTLHVQTLHDQDNLSTLFLFLKEHRGSDLGRILRTSSCSNLSLFLRLDIEAQYPELYIKGLILGVILWNFKGV